MDEDDYFDSAVQGEDFEWFATDFKGHIALLTTAGFGAVPIATFRSLRQYSLCAAYLDELPLRSDIVQHSPCAGVMSWIKAAQQGMFVYDYSDETEAYGSYRADKPYHRVVSPLRPLKLPELPSEIRNWLQAIQFKTVDFAQAHEIYPESEFLKVNV